MQDLASHNLVLLDRCYLKRNIQNTIIEQIRLLQPNIDINIIRKLITVLQHNYSFLIIDNYNIFKYKDTYVFENKQFS